MVKSLVSERLEQRRISRVFFPYVTKSYMCGLGSGLLAGRDIIADAPVPEFWPFRNQLLITLAAMRFVGQASLKICIGSVREDSSHKDGTVEFVDAIRSLMILQEGKVEVLAPAIEYESLDLLRASKIDADVLDMTFSCFQSEYPCGRCRGCLKNEDLRARYYHETVKRTCSEDGLPDQKHLRGSLS
jgi:7-cyano-7-deazaguanine synthase in queuosine biosynthesis